MVYVGPPEKKWKSCSGMVPGFELLYLGSVEKKSSVIQKTGWLRVRDFPIGLKYVNKTHYNP